MRQIKFRAWDKLEKRMRHNIELFMIPSWTKPMLSMGDMDVMQFTGLFDKHGKEIYEGDIVKWEPEYINIREAPKAVEYEWSGYRPFQYDGGGEYHPSECIVIGNIYENPELLE